MCLCKTPITFIDLTIITFLASENQHGSESKMSWLQWLLLYVYQIRRLELGVLVSSDEFLTLAKLVSASCNQKLKGVVVGTLRPDVAVKWGKKNYFKTTAMIVFFFFYLQKIFLCLQTVFSWPVVLREYSLVFVDLQVNSTRYSQMFHKLIDRLIYSPETLKNWYKCRIKRSASSP